MGRNPSSALSSESIRHIELNHFCHGKLPLPLPPVWGRRLGSSKSISKSRSPQEAEENFISAVRYTPDLGISQSARAKLEYRHANNQKSRRQNNHGVATGCFTLHLKIKIAYGRPDLLVRWSVLVQCSSLLIELGHGQISITTAGKRTGGL